MAGTENGARNEISKGLAPELSIAIELQQRLQELWPTQHFRLKAASVKGEHNVAWLTDNQRFQLICRRIDEGVKINLGNQVSLVWNPKVEQNEVLDEILDIIQQEQENHYPEWIKPLPDPEQRQQLFELYKRIRKTCESVTGKARLHPQENGELAKIECMQGTFHRVIELVPWPNQPRFNCELIGVESHYKLGRHRVWHTLTPTGHRSTFAVRTQQELEGLLEELNDCLLALMLECSMLRYGVITGKYAASDFIGLKPGSTRYTNITGHHPHISFKITVNDHTGEIPEVVLAKWWKEETGQEQCLNELQKKPPNWEQLSAETAQIQYRANSNSVDLRW